LEGNTPMLIALIVVWVVVIPAVVVVLAAGLGARRDRQPGQVVAPLKVDAAVRRDCTPTPARSRRRNFELRRSTGSRRRLQS
jgi:hypothetical protein